MTPEECLNVFTPQQAVKILKNMVNVGHNTVGTTREVRLEGARDLLRVEDITPYMFLLRAFHWYPSPEGDRYWRNLSTEIDRYDS